MIIMTVAILGGLGVYMDKHHASPTVMANSGSNSTAQMASSQSMPDVSYKDGTYTGSVADTIYGKVEVAAVISGGKITDIQFLKMPDDQENSKVVTAMAEPRLKSETLSKQSADIDFVSGATQTSEGFEQSLQAALDQAAQS